MLLALAGRWESGNVHIGQQGSVLGLPMDHLKIDELKKARNDSNVSNEYANLLCDMKTVYHFVVIIDKTRGIKLLINNTLDNLNV